MNWSCSAHSSSELNGMAGQDTRYNSLQSLQAGFGFVICGGRAIAPQFGDNELYAYHARGATDDGRKVTISCNKHEDLET